MFGGEKMKSLNETSTLWSDVTVEVMEPRDEYGKCFCVSVHIKCFEISCV